ncbi:oxysterol-binding protein-related protein 9-like [Cimex lectularius]|uniref:PH domain-containing protein n=1 Tax=Cimex lectularius TaxID=79782 RepID=A0A8I6SHP1_CIMLE|nr:oxysterol-binding protein-related protein 9-like [Cimex lectularius]
MTENVVSRFRAMEERRKVEPYQGELLKYTNIFRGWQNRWFVLDSDMGVLKYYQCEPSKCKRPKGSIYLKNAIISTSDEDPLSFSVVSKEKSSAKLRAKSMQERNSWMEKLALVAERHSVVSDSPIPRRPTSVGPDADFRKALEEAEQSVTKSCESYFYLSRALDTLPLPPYGPFYNLGPELQSLKECSEAMQESLTRCIASVRDSPIETVQSTKSKDTLRSKKSLKIPPPMSLEKSMPLASSKSRHCFNGANNMGATLSNDTISSNNSFKANQQPEVKDLPTA